MRLLKTTWRLALLMAIMTALGYTAAAYVQTGSRSKTRSSHSASRQAVLKVTVEGEQFALRERGSGTKTERTYLFRVTKATAEDGTELTNLRGQVLRYLDTSRSRELINKYGGRAKLVIKGTLHPQERVLEVASFKKAATSRSGSRGSAGRRRGSGHK